MTVQKRHQIVNKNTQLKSCSIVICLMYVWSQHWYFLFTTGFSLSFKVLFLYKSVLSGWLQLLTNILQVFWSVITVMTTEIRPGASCWLMHVFLICDIFRYKEAKEWALYLQHNLSHHRLQTGADWASQRESTKKRKKKGGRGWKTQRWNEMGDREGEERRRGGWGSH